MPVTLEDLIESVRKLADSNLATAAALSKLLSPFEQLRRNIADFKDAHELQQASLILTVGKLNTDLALILDNVRHAQGDVANLARDVTASHQLPPRDERSTAERIIDRIERAPTATKLWVFALLLVLGVAFGLHLILAAFGIGG